MTTGNANTYDRRGVPRDRTLRVGDREREAVAEILRRQHVEGRLDAVEFNERLERCLAAKTYGELDELIADLPGQERQQPRGTRAWTWSPVPPLPLLLIPLALIAIVLSHGHLVWLVFPLVFFVIRPFLWHSWRRGRTGRGPRPPMRTETDA